ncbi:MAG: hypothetical protein DMG10_05720 [Acidobacteria bacterium]|nr:MAG: hypothetical protein DMG10_05720 [Acidobacteriota bacterium]
MAAMLVRGLVWTNATFGVSDSYLLPLLNSSFSQTILLILLSCQKKSTDTINGIQKRGQDNGIGLDGICPLKREF